MQLLIVRFRLLYSTFVYVDYIKVIKMRRITLTFFALSFAFLTLSQQDSFDSRLLDKYTATELSQIQQNNAEEYNILVRALDVGLVIADYVEKDGEKMSFDGVLDANPNEKHTYISLGVELIEDRNQYFKFKDSNKIAIIYSKNTILKIK